MTADVLRGIAEAHRSKILQTRISYQLEGIIGGFLGEHINADKFDQITVSDARKADTKSKASAKAKASVKAKAMSRANAKTKAEARAKHSNKKSKMKDYLENNIGVFSCEIISNNGQSEEVIASAKLNTVKPSADKLNSILQGEIT